MNLSKPITKKVPEPTEKNVRCSLKKWKTLQNYKDQERALNMVFGKFCPQNKKIEDVLLKVCALNDFYSTHIFAVYPVAEHILKNRIDRKIDTAEYEIVNKLAKIQIKSKRKNFYSFASKYCGHHKPKDFPMYDYHVERMLMHYKRIHRNEDGFPKFKKDDLRNYPKFVQIISEFQNHFRLNKFTLRQIDIFLWLTGRDYFPRVYKKA